MVVLSAIILFASFVPVKKQTTSCKNDTFSVVRLDKRINHIARLKATNKTGKFEYALSNNVSCYVVNESDFSALQRRNVNNYLESGGAIVVNGKNLSMKSIVAKVDVPSGQLNFLDSNETYGTFLYKTERGIEINSYTVDFIEDSEKLSAMSNEEEQFYVGKAEENLNTDDIIDWIVEIIKEHLYEIKDNQSDDEKQTIENKTREEIPLGTASCYNLLFGLLTGRRMCSYKIVSEVKQGQKYIDNNNKRRGIYDITSKYFVGVENGFGVRRYQPYITSNEEIMDATYIRSDVKDKYTFGGGLNFDGKEVGVSINFNSGYDVDSTGQDITNSFDFAKNSCTWTAKPMKPLNFGESYTLTPGIRIISKDDTAWIHADLGMKDFINGTIFWYQMADSTRKTLHLNWKADEEISYTETIGY